MSRLTGKLGAAVRARRLRLGLSQEALAALADVSRTHVSEVERGTANVSILTLERLAKALNVELSDLLKGT